MIVDPRSVTPRTQQNPRGISRGDVLELADGRLAVAERGIDAQRMQVRLVNDADAKSLDKAIHRFQSFTGMTPKGITRVQRPKQSAVAMQIGELVGVMYETVRDGKREKYFHRFKKSARPHLAASPDGRRLEILGGEFQFTERGIVDA